MSKKLHITLPILAAFLLMGLFSTATFAAPSVKAESPDITHVIVAVHDPDPESPYLGIEIYGSWLCDGSTMPTVTLGIWELFVEELLDCALLYAYLDDFEVPAADYKLIVDSNLKATTPTEMTLTVGPVAPSVRGLVTDGSSPPQLVITDFEVDAAGTTLTIFGHHFDNGVWPSVTLGGVDLGADSRTPTEVVTTVADPTMLVGELLLIVETGDLPENRDAYPYRYAVEDPAALPDHLLVDSVEIEVPEEQDRYIFTIGGQDLDYGAPVAVTLGPHPLTIISSTADRIEAQLLTFTGLPTADYLMIVSAGTELEGRDALVLNVDVPLGEEPPPDPGEVCHDNAPEVCWKQGPIKRRSKRLYFQLLEDYEIDLESYFLVRQFPLRFRTENWRTRILNRLRTIDVPRCAGDGCDPDAGWDYVILQEGTLTIKKGYRWDGPSTPRDIKKMHNMRASLVHDSLYDLMRLGIIKHDGASDTVWTEGGQNRLLADLMFYWLAWDDSGKKHKAKASFNVIRFGGAPKTRKDLVKDWPWKWHSVASAGSDVTSDCGPEPVKLNGSWSRWTWLWEWWEDGKKIADGNRPEIPFELGSHTVTLEVDDPFATFRYDPDHFPDQEEVLITVNEDVVPPEFGGLPSPDVGNDPGLCSAVVEFEVIATDSCSEVTVSCVPPSGSAFPVGGSTVLCTAEDTSGNPAYAQFPVFVRDIESPVMTGITAPITMRVRNHKYVTLTVGDFVYSVADNCTALSLDDLVFTQVISSEPQDMKGDGHTDDDFVIAPDGRSVNLRMERRGRGNGRAYTVDIEATDEYGNAVTESFQVQVTHDNKRGRAIGF